MPKSKLLELAENFERLNADEVDRFCGFLYEQYKKASQSDLTAGNMKAVLLTALRMAQAEIAKKSDH